MKLVYFAWIRERVGLAEEDVELPDDVATVRDLLSWLKSRGENYAHALENEQIVRIAVDRQHVDDSGFPLSGAKEIALFPPMTGG